MGHSNMLFRGKSMYTFNFNLGGEPNIAPAHDFMPLIEALKSITEDWQSFYNLYKKFAPPPIENQVQIQSWFNEIKDALDEVVELYNKIPDAPILESIHNTEDAAEMLSKFNEINNIIKTVKSDNDSHMYN